MNILICTAQVPFVSGGAELHVANLKRALIEAGHEADVVALPFKWYPPREIIRSALAWRMLDVTEANGKPVDMVIGMKFPAYLVEHPRKVLWVIHQYRSAYDMAGTDYDDLHSYADGAATKMFVKHVDEKFIPRAFLDASYSQRLDLLRGLLDTDGGVERWGTIRYATSSRRLADDVAELVRSLGGWCSVVVKRARHIHRGERREGREGFVANIHHPNPGSLFLLSGKQARAPASPVRCKRPTFASITPARVAQAQCIAVSHPSRLYVTDDYVVTHNTAFALNIGENVALNTGMPVAVFSMEMGASQLALRLIGSVGKLDQHKLRTGRLGPEDWDKLSTALGRLNEAPILIDETPALNAIEVRSRARRLMKQYGKLGLVIVDYLQLMQASTQGENRATEISEISRAMKSLAKELHVPVVALSQLNRSLEQRPNKRPVMSDLRESGAIEQDADVIVFIYRDEVYNAESQDKGTAEIIIGKQRNGPIGTVKLTFLGKHTRFENYSGGSGY